MVAAGSGRQGWDLPRNKHVGARKRQVMLKEYEMICSGRHTNTEIIKSRI